MDRATLFGGFRVIEEMRPTLLIDEADTFLRGNDELRGILNSGYTRKTAYVVRVANQFTRYHLPAALSVSAVMPTEGETDPVASGATRLVRFSCWCPKVMAAIGRLPDTLADRCIVVRMQRKMEGEVCERLKNLDATPLRRQCARFAQDHGENIAKAHPVLPPNTNDRAGDIWEPLLALADLAGDAWPVLARQSAMALTASAQEHSPISALLIDIATQFVRTKDDRMASREMVARLNDSPDRPWAAMRHSGKISEKWLPDVLRPYGVRTRTIRFGAATARGYSAAEFKEVFRRYIPRSEIEAFLVPAREAQPQPESPPAA
jgi:hypothetical protein